VAGEVVFTVGVIVLLFTAWYLWIGDWITAAQRNATGQSISHQWAAHAGTDTPKSPAGATTTPPILPQPVDAQIFATMHIPRFGTGYDVPIAGGVTKARTLDPIGIGHYPGTPMPGAIGNVALAAHRTTYGKPFNLIATLHIGDAIVIETKAGWYTYRFRNLEYVTPTQGQVILPVPQAPTVRANGRYLTMTSCSPEYSSAERIVAFSVFESFTPRAAGPPASLRARA
jgi:sortase A